MAQASYNKATWSVVSERRLMPAKSRLVTKYLKFKLYRTVIRPIGTYASETWVLKETVIHKLLVFERKILRRIFGPIKEAQIWRTKTNKELDKLIKHKNTVNCIKARRLSWFGQVQRMPDTGTVKKIFKWKPPTKRSQERPECRWEDNIKQDICQMKIKNSIACVQDREDEEGGGGGGGGGEGEGEQEEEGGGGGGEGGGEGGGGEEGGGG